MFGIGFWELVVIVLVILLVLGPDKLGPIARAVGRAVREMRRGVDEFKDTFGVDDKVREIETLRNEFVGAMQSLDADEDPDEEDVGGQAEEVEVVRSRGPADRDDFPEVTQDEKDG